MPVIQFKDRANALLAQGLAELSMTLGVLARVERDSYEIVAVQSNSGAYVAGEKYELGQSYSRKVCDSRKSIAESHVDAAEHELPHPLYRSLPLESYIGAPIIVDGECWGCIDFSSMAQRDEPFDKNDLDLINDLAIEIAQLLDADDDRAARL